MRVFVSSVINGFEAYRQAAREAITLLGLSPVMAEDFPAQPHSPQAACLAGVRSADVYVGILGPRYGVTTASGHSATEEEFEEASRLSLPRLIFISTGQADPDQAAFIERIGGWGAGLLYGKFTTPDVVKDQIIKALAGMLGQRRSLSPQEAALRLDQLLGPGEHDDANVVLSLALIPQSGEETLVGLDEIDSLATDLPRLAAPITRGGAKGVVRAKETSAQYACASTRETALAIFEAFDDGQMTCRLELRPPDENSLAAIYIIDVNRIEAGLKAIIETFSAVLAHIDRRGAVTKVYLQGRLKGVHGRTLDKMPKEPVHSMTLPSHELPDPLPFPTRPHAASLPDLINAGKMAQTLLSALRRIFNEGGGSS